MKTVTYALIVALAASAAAATQTATTSTKNGYSDFVRSAPGEIRISPLNDSR